MNILTKITELLPNIAFVPRERFEDSGLIRYHQEVHLTTTTATSGSDPILAWAFIEDYFISFLFVTIYQNVV